MKKIFLVASMFAVLIPSALAAKGVNSVSVSEPVVAGSSFSASFTTVKKNVYPWGFLSCDGGVEEWRANQGDGTIGVFELLDTPAGATCTIDLVDISNYTVLATVSFVVS